MFHLDTSISNHQMATSNSIDNLTLILGSKKDDDVESETASFICTQIHDDNELSTDFNSKENSLNKNEIKGM